VHGSSAAFPLGLFREPRCGPPVYYACSSIAQVNVYTHLFGCGPVVLTVLIASFLNGCGIVIGEGGANMARVAARRSRLDLFRHAESRSGGAASDDVFLLSNDPE
jgi:hypothetical protein